MADHDHGHDEHGDLMPVFIRVFIALLILTAISFAAGSYHWPRPQVGWAIMMAVSCMKALLVISFFMHLKWEANWKYVLTIPASIMSVFLVLMLWPDVASRGQNTAEERERFMAPAEVSEKAEDSHGASEAPPARH